MWVRYHVCLLGFKLARVTTWLYQMKSFWAAFTVTKGVIVGQIHLRHALTCLKICNIS